MESAPRTFPWHGSTTMFNHLPYSSLLDKLAECAAVRKKSVCLNAQCMRALENMCAVRCLSAPPAQIEKHSFIITLSISRSRHKLSRRIHTNAHVLFPCVSGFKQHSVWLSSRSSLRHLSQAKWPVSYRNKNRTKQTSTDPFCSSAKKQTAA